MGFENKAVVLMNLGSPESTSVKDVRKYLREFLMDERVIDLPLVGRFLLVQGIIVPFRAPKSAKAYESIWTKDGSPLVIYTQQLREAVAKQIDAPVEISMRYGSLTPQRAYDNLLKQNPNINEVILVPLYPHYAMSSYETAVEYMYEQHKKLGYTFKLSTIKPYYNEPRYINAMLQSMQPYLEQAYDHILFSYHGVPQRHLTKTDCTGTHCLKVNNCCEVKSAAHAVCYKHQCFETTRLITEALQIPKEKYSISFQSRLGKGWVQPFTDMRLKELPTQGVKKLLIICPAFVSDCLETIEEIGVEGKETFLHAGGEQYTMIPCLNVSPSWVTTISQYITDYCHGNPQMMLNK